MTGFTRIDPPFLGSHAAHRCSRPGGRIAGGSAPTWASYDSFSYTPGQALAGMNGGTGFAGAWKPGTLGSDDSAAYQVQGSSLGGGLLPSLGGRVASPGGLLAGKRFDSRPRSADRSGEQHRLHQHVAPRGWDVERRGFGRFLLVSCSTASTTSSSLSQDLFIGKTSGSNFGIEDRGGNNSHMSSTAAAIGVSNLLVVRAEFSASGPDKFTLYVNPTNASMGEGIVKQDSELGMVNSVSIYSTGAFSLDELRIGTALGDVMPAGESIGASAVPEPASVLMLGIASLGAVAVTQIRRRRITVG